MDSAAILSANLQQAERRVQGAVCPIYGIDERDRPQLIGSSVPFRLGTRSFLLTAAHVLDENRRTSLYVGGLNDLVPLAGSSHRTGTPIAGRRGDTFDFGFVDISETPPEQWLRYQFVTPDYLDVDDVPAADVLYAFVGYPETRNKRLKGQKFQLSPMAIVLMPTPLKRYDSLGLNPTAQFAGEFSRNKQLDSEKRIVVGPEPNGISGGGVWRLGTPREFATGTNAERLVGLGIEYRASHSVLVGVRISLVVAALAEVFPELGQNLPRPALVRTNFMMGDPPIQVKSARPK